MCIVISLLVVQVCIFNASHTYFFMVTSEWLFFILKTKLVQFHMTQGTCGQPDVTDIAASVNFYLHWIQTNTGM